MILLRPNYPDSNKLGVGFWTDGGVLTQRRKGVEERREVLKAYENGFQ